MGIAITEEHRELEKIARSFLGAQKARLLSRELLDAPSEGLPTFWSELAELGWLGCTSLSSTADPASDCPN